MDKLNLFFSQGKNTSETYMKDAEKTISVINKSIDKGEFSELSQKLDSLNVANTARNKYVFNQPKSVIPLVLIITSSVFLFLFLCFIPVSIGTLLYSDEFKAYAVGILSVTVIVVLINVAIIYMCVSQMRFERRYAEYLNVLRYRNIEIIDDLAAYANVKTEKVIGDLIKATKLKLIPQGHFGRDNMIFIVSDDIYESYKNKQTVYDRYYRKQVEERLRMKERTKEIQKILEQGQQYVEKIHESNDIIKDKMISQKLDRMEKIVSMIFHEVDINPEQADKLGMFMNYYLPTTEKLLEKYMEIDDKQVKGKTLEKTKKDIESAIDKLINSFETILDKFYQAQELDIASDISAMEIMMQQEGLIE